MNENIFDVDLKDITQNTEPAKYKNLKVHKNKIDDKIILQVANIPLLKKLYYYVLKKYHYFPSHRRWGREIKFIISDGELDFTNLYEGLPTNLLGVIAVGSALGWNLPCRDNVIGWDNETKRKNFNKYFAEETRFQIVPYIKIPNLISMVMSKYFKACKKYWQEKYEDKLVLLQAYSDNIEYGGISYKASGWIYIGTTKKGNRNIFIKPLYPYWKNILNKK